MAKIRKYCRKALLIPIIQLKYFLITSSTLDFICKEEYKIIP